MIERNNWVVIFRDPIKIYLLRNILRIYLVLFPDTFLTVDR